MKLGFMLGYWMPDPFDPLEWALEAEGLGYDSIWAGEAYGSDAITPLAAPHARVIVSDLLP